MILGILLLTMQTAFPGWSGFQLCYADGTCQTIIGQTAPDEFGTTSDIWQYKNVTWEGNPWCYQLGLFTAHVQLPTDDGGTVWADSVGACRNMTQAVIVVPLPPAPASTLTIN